MEQTKLRSLRIKPEDLLELVKRAAARGEIECPEMSPAVRVHHDWKPCGIFEHGLGGMCFILSVEAEQSKPAETDRGYIPFMDVVLKEEML